MTTYISPCKYCGSHEIEIAKETDGRYFAICTHCFAHGPISPNATVAIENWNSGATPEEDEKKSERKYSSCIIILIIFALYLILHFGLYLLFEHFTG